MQIITTGDGSHTLFSEQFNEIYHSRHGAIREGQHVFIQNGLDYCIESCADEPLRIFEVGFGTGLNAILTFIETQQKQRKVYYETIELYPVSIELIKELNYSLLLENEKYRPPYHSLHLSTWNTEHDMNPSFRFKKNQASLLEFQAASSFFNLIYFDAFAPEHQPEMWTEAIMQRMYVALKPKGILVSYCSKSSFQRALKGAGFVIEKLAGPPGKREMIRAKKI